MKIAILSPLATVAPHFETELEIAQRHLDAGDEVRFLACAGALACCDFNATHKDAKCGSCFGRRRAGVELLEGRAGVDHFANRPLPIQIPAEVYGSLDQLRRFRVENFDVGFAVLSSLVSICRDPQPDLNGRRAIVERLLRAALTTYFQTLEYCRRRRPDRVYVFNGRFAAARAVWRACQAEGVDCWMHERGCDTHHFQLFENRLPHDIDYIQSRMKTAWEAAAADPRRVPTAASWFHDRVNRVERNWHSFVKGQSKGRLPADWDPRRRNVAIFTSSEDEFVAIGDNWRNGLYASQNDGLARIFADAEQLDPRFKLYVRVHPNLKNVRNENVRTLLRMGTNRITIIPPEDSVDSYELLRRCEKVVTFGSSIGIEAVYWGVPSILLGPCFYRGLSGVRQPDSHAAAMDEIAAEIAPPTDQTGALIYGYWFQTQGIRFNYFEASGLFEGRFRGQIVHDPRRPNPLRRMASKVKRWVRRQVA